MRRFIYLISPPKIDSGFYQSLKEVLTSEKVKFFQLRVKHCSNSKLIEITKRIRVITKKYKVKLIINDLPLVAKCAKADGCHLGQTDISINHARKILKKNKIIGTTCHGSKKLILKAIKENANYVALGSFFKSQLKPSAKKAQKKLIIWCKKKTNVPALIRKAHSIPANFIISENKTGPIKAPI
mgnify:CR=1 FL=1